MKKINYIILLCIVLASPVHSMKRSSDEAFSNELDDEIYSTLEQLPTELLIIISEHAGLPDKEIAPDKELREALGEQIRMLARLRMTCWTFYNNLPLENLCTSFKKYPTPVLNWYMWLMVGGYMPHMHDDAAPWLKVLLAAGAQPEASTKRYSWVIAPIVNYFPLQSTAALGFAQCMQALLQAGAKPDAVPRRCHGIPLQYTPLQLAVTGGHVRCVEILLKTPADRTVQNRNWSTLLHLSANAQITKLLIAARLDVHAHNARQETPLFAAVQRGDKESIQLLLQAGAHVERTMIKYAIERGGSYIAAILDGNPNSIDNYLKLT